jgi:hypothetical protein
MPIDPNEVSAVWRVLGGTTLLGVIVSTRKLWLPFITPGLRKLWTFLDEHWHYHETIEHQRSKIRQGDLAYRREHAMRLFAESQFKEATEDIEGLTAKVMQPGYPDGSITSEKTIPLPSLPPPSIPT